MKNLFCLIVVFLFATTVWAGPFWVCAPQENVTHYGITGAIEVVVPAQDLGDGTLRIHYDLDGITEGEYSCNITARNIWGSSDPVPFYFNKTLPACPSAMDISAQ